MSKKMYMSGRSFPGKIVKAAAVGAMAYVYSRFLESTVIGLVPADYKKYVPTSVPYEAFATSFLASLTLSSIRDYVLKPVSPQVAQIVPE